MSLRLISVNNSFKLDIVCVFIVIGVLDIMIFTQIGTQIKLDIKFNEMLVYHYSLGCFIYLWTF